MTLTVFCAVLVAAVLHALWNAMIKSGADKQTSMAAVVIGHLPVALLVLPFVPMPNLACWPWLLAGVCLHFGYQSFLLHAYRIADLTQVYPIARGVAPLIVAAVSVLFLGVTLQALELAAVLTIGIGILSLTLVRKADGMRNLRGAQLALITGCFIASYSLVDGTGARIAGTALGFYSCLAIGNALIMIVYMAKIAPATLRRLPWIVPKVFLFGGAASYIAYGIVIWAFTQAPIALVTALRESSIVFALLIGVFFLKERLNLGKVLSTALTLAGVAMLRAAKH